MSVRVIFEVSCPTASFEEVCVVGSLPELGAWDSARAVPLKTSEQSYPVWRTPELLLSCQVSALVQYKYIKLGSGSSAQWEVGPNRILDLACLSETMVNCVEDVTLDIDEDLARRSNGARIRFQESGCLAKSQVNSRATSRPASSIPSPLRTSAGQTPVEKSPRGMQELEGVLRELMDLESMNLSGRADLRRAIAAVRSAIEAEQGGGSPYQFRRCSGCTCAAFSLLLVPLLPLIVASVILWRVPSARPKRPGSGGGVTKPPCFRGYFPACVSSGARAGPLGGAAAVCSGAWRRAPGLRGSGGAAHGQ